MTNRELMAMLIRIARKYQPVSKLSIIRNRHMHKLEEDDTNQDHIDAVIVDFCNFIASENGIDLALYTSDLE